MFYVRDDGGTATQCTGQADAAYDGAGTGEACAYIHPAWALGGGGGSNGVMASGDTLIIDNESHTSPGTQAKYVVGYTMPNHTGPNCDVTNFAYGCTMNTVPAGIDSNNKTKIYGKGYGNCTSTATTSKAQLWGQGRATYVLGLGGGNIDIQCLEITDHSGCIYSGPSDGTLANGDPVKCSTSANGATAGDFAITGIYDTVNTGSDGINIQNVDIHGMAYRSVYLYRMNDVTVTNSNLITGGFVGWDSDANNGCTTAGFPFTIPAACSAYNNSNGTTDCVTNTTGASGQTCASCTADTGNNCFWRRDDYTGTVVLDKVKIQFSGCGEVYPRTDWNWDSTTDIHHCWSQDQGGFGDGIGLGDGAPGNWTIQNNSSVSWNTSDGVDLLHGSGTGTIKFIRSLAEGNAGQAFKTSAATSYIENSAIIGNCGFHYHQSFTSTKDTNGSTVAFNTCRANGDTIAFANGSTAGRKLYISNSTILSNGDNAIVSSGSACDATTKLYVYNNIIRGGRQFNDDTSINGAGGNDTSDYYYASGSDGNGAGPCGSLAITNDYNIIYGTKNIASDTDCTSPAHNQCNVDPLFTGTIKQGPYTSPGYYNTPDYYQQLYLNISSPAIGANVADETITMTGTANDYNNYDRGSAWDLGMFEYGSTPSGSTTVSKSSGTNGSVRLIGAVRFR